MVNGSQNFSWTGEINFGPWDFKKPVRDVRKKLKLSDKFERSCFEKYDRITYIIDESN